MTSITPQSLLGMIVNVITFKLDPKLKYLLRCEAEQLLAEGKSVADAAAAIVGAGRCAPHIAKDICEYVKTYHWSRTKKPRT